MDCVANEHHRRKPRIGDLDLRAKKGSVWLSVRRALIAAIVSVEQVTQFVEARRAIGARMTLW